MELLRCRARLSVLWITMAIGTAVGSIFNLIKPGGIDAIMAGEMGFMELNSGTLIVYMCFFLIPMLMAILCLTLNVSATRWLSFALGVVWMLWFIYEIVGLVTWEGTVCIAMWLLLGAAIIISAYIIYFSWKLPS